jgi:adenosylcobinamide kinase/adenosylcobinamide-phosphate guanylyltransferase
MWLRRKRLIQKCKADCHHQNQRPAHWSLVEEPLFLAKTLQEIDRPNQIILVDCLTLWLTNLLLLEDQNIQQFECEQLLKFYPHSSQKLF